MHRRALAGILALVLSITALAGCVEDAPPGPAEPVPSQGDSGEPAADPAADLAVDNGTAGEEAGVGHQPHMHDYWDGKERVTLLDAEIEPEPGMALFMTFVNTFRGTPGAGGFFFELPEGRIVYEGTGKLEFTATWTDPTVTGMGLSYRSAATTDWSDREALESGTPFVVELTPEMTDIPHAKSSKWAFWLAPAKAGQVIAGPVHVRVDIIKMRDIMEFPGHPELFHGAHTLTLLEGSGTSTQSSFPMRFVGFLAGSDEDQSLPAEKVVPMETRSMTANLTIRSTSAGVGEVTDVRLLVKTADSGGYRPAERVGGDLESGTLQFAWLVEPEQTDSPYAKESQWRFDVRAATDPTGMGDGQCGGCSDTTVEYDLTVVAYDAPVEGAAPLQDWRRGG